MQRRHFIATLFALIAGGSARRSRATEVAHEYAHEVSESFPPLKSRNLPWHQLLESERFQILFLQETEFAGSSPLNDEKRRGTYVCAACYLPLFRSEHKYNSGTGWPSFTQAIPSHTATRVDHRAREPIVEYHCARCSGHQGHIFKDGPPPRGERWCNNGLALEFIPEGRALPPLRA